MYVCRGRSDLCMYDRKVPVLYLRECSIRVSLSSPRAGNLLPAISVRDYLRSCANLSLFVTLVAAVESVIILTCARSNGTYESAYISLIVINQGG